jgi:hypothetical protein
MSAVLSVRSGAAAVRAFIKAGRVVDRQRGSHTFECGVVYSAAPVAWEGSFAALIADSGLSVASCEVNPVTFVVCSSCP